MKLKTYQEFLNESITLSPSKALSYFKGIQKRIGSKKISTLELKQGTKVMFDTGLTFLLVDLAIVGFNQDGSDNFIPIPPSVNSFNDLENNIRILNSAKGKALTVDKIIKEPGIPIDSSTSKEDLSEYGIKELKDGLTLEQIKKDFPWLLKAHIENAVIGIDSKKNLIWYSGTWKQGYWENGFWYNGTWEDGIWEDGIWNKGTWYNGNWNNGTWENGFWYNGTWEDGIWEDGIWNKGTWKYGTWKYGTWKYGTWYNGNWNNGTWEYGDWNDGTWRDGTWEDGEWYNGTWKKGTWKKGTWKNGTWEGGKGRPKSSNF